MEITEKKALASLDNYIKNIDAQRKLNQSSRQVAPVTDKEGDKVELSADAKQIQTAGRLIKAMPEIREEKVAHIRNQLKTGTYQIDSGKIAAAMLKEALSDENI